MSKKSESETESFTLKIETQKSTENNPFTGMKDQREIYRSKNQGKSPKNKNPNNQYFIAIIIVVILTAVYYAMITKYRRGVLLTKVYHSICVGIVFIIDRFLNFDQYDNLFIIEENIDTELKQDLLDSNYSKPNGLDTQNSSNINSVDTEKSEGRIGFTKNMLLTLMIAMGVVSFFVELITFFFIELQDDDNLGLVFCLISYEFIFIKLYNHLTINHNLDLANILGLVGIYLGAITLNLMFFSKYSMYFSILISSLRFLRYYLHINLKNQFANVVLMVTVITDLCLGIICLFGILYAGKFYFISFSSFIIVFFASSCYFFYLKNYKIFDITIYSFIYPVLGVIDLIINNRDLSVVTFGCMLGITGFVLLAFMNDSKERNIFSYKNNEFTRQKK